MSQSIPVLKAGKLWFVTDNIALQSCIASIRCCNYAAKAKDASFSLLAFKKFVSVLGVRQLRCSHNPDNPTVETRTPPG